MQASASVAGSGSISQTWGQILEYLYFVVFKYLFLVFVFVFVFLLCGHSSICICS